MSTRTLGTIAAFVVALLLGACGGGGGGSGSSLAPAPSPSPTPQPTPVARSVQGTIAAQDISLVDSDTNDPNQQGRTSNDSPATAQVASNPALIAGYVNLPATGPAGANFTAGDRWDSYRVDLIAGQIVELNFGDSSTADLDLYVADAAGNILAASTGLTRSECVRIARTGSYVVGVNAFSGYASYELSWGVLAPNSSCPNVAASVEGGTPFVPGQLIAKQRAGSTGALDSQATALLKTAQFGIKSASPATTNAMLIELPAASAQRQRTMTVLAERTRSAAQKTLAQQPPAGLSAESQLAFETIIAAKQLAASGAFEYVELNAYAYAQQSAYVPGRPNDALLARQPHLGLIRLPEAFDALASIAPRPTYTPIVAVIDTGIVADHPDLQRMLVAGYDFISDAINAGDGGGIDSNPDDARGQFNPSFHGTHVAGTIAAETFNGQGVVGVAPMARIMPIRVLGVTGTGTQYDIVQGIRYAAGLPNDSGTVPPRRADVINLSLGGQGVCPSAYADAIAAARAQGVLVVAAAGNEGGALVGRPANCNGAIAVSAISYDGRLASYSNLGPQVAVTAPGGDVSRVSPAGTDVIFSTWATFVSGVRRPNYQGLHGTSMATPHVAGVLALMRAVNPNLTPVDIDTLLASGAITNDLGASGRDASFGYGLIDAMKAVTAAATTTGGAITALPTLELTPAVLDFGTTLTELPITIRRVNNSTDTPAVYVPSSLNPAAVTVVDPPAGNPTNGPFNYLVRVNRQLLAPGENVIRVEIISTQNRRLPFDVAVTPRPAGAITNRGVGPVYALAINADTLATAGGSGPVVSTSPNYSYTISGVTAPRVFIVAGTDTDNDNFICGPSEPCGIYPLLSDAVILDLNANKTGIDFALISGSASAASASLAADATRAVPSRGFRRN